MGEKQQLVVQDGEEILLKDLILKIQDWGRYLVSKWLIILLLVLIGAGLGLTFSLLQKPQYVGKLTFVMEDSKANPLSTYIGLASQFGIDLGNSGGGGIFEGDNIMEFLKSRLMIEKTLLTPVEIDNEKRSLADLYIKFNGLDKKWAESTTLKGLYFPPNTDRTKFTLQQDSILNFIQKRIIKKNLQVDKADKKLSFISVTCTSPNETFSKAFTERLVKEAINFYVSTKIQRSKVNVDKLQLAADSLEQLLNRKTYSLAATKDINMNPIKQVASAGLEVQSRDKMVLQTMYAEVVKNLELSKMAMAQEMPIVQIVDTPILPLDKKKLGRLIGVIIGAFLGGFLSVMFLIILRLYRIVMS